MGAVLRLGFLFAVIDAIALFAPAAIASPVVEERSQE